jgi:hypothetical protein
MVYYLLFGWRTQNFTQAQRADAGKISHRDAGTERLTHPFIIHHTKSSLLTTH